MRATTIVRRRLRFLLLARCSTFSSKITVASRYSRTSHRSTHQQVRDHRTKVHLKGSSTGKAQRRRIPGQFQAHGSPLRRSELMDQMGTRHYWCREITRVGVGYLEKDSVGLVIDSLVLAELPSLDLPEQLSIPLRFVPSLVFRAKRFFRLTLQLVESVASRRIGSLVCASYLLLLAREPLYVVAMHLLAYTVFRSPAVVQAILVIAYMALLRFASPSYLHFGRTHRCGPSQSVGSMRWFRDTGVECSNS